MPKQTEWEVPKSLTVLRTLPVRIKPDWHGFAAKLVGAVLWLGELVRVRAATRALDRFVQVIDGVIYAPRGSDGKLGKGLLTHESVHDYQQRTRGKVRYVLGYYCSRKYRRHAEAMAYAVEVAIGARGLQDAAESASDPIYAMKWTQADASVLIGSYVKQWTTQCKGVAEARRSNG